MLLIYFQNLSCWNTRKSAGLLLQHVWMTGAGIDESVRVVCRLRSGRSGFQIPEREGEFSSPKRQSLPFVFLWVECPGRVANHSPPSSAADDTWSASYMRHLLAIPHQLPNLLSTAVSYSGQPLMPNGIQCTRKQACCRLPLCAPACSVAIARCVIGPPRPSWQRVWAIHKARR